MKSIVGSSKRETRTAGRLRVGTTVAPRRSGTETVF